jgi:hypothetical protein
MGNSSLTQGEYSSAPMAGITAVDIATVMTVLKVTVFHSGREGIFFIYSFLLAHFKARVSTGKATDYFSFR